MQSIKNRICQEHSLLGNDVLILEQAILKKSSKKIETEYCLLEQNMRLKQPVGGPNALHI